MSGVTTSAVRDDDAYTSMETKDVTDEEFEELEEARIRCLSRRPAILQAPTLRDW